MFKRSVTIANSTVSREKLFSLIVSVSDVLVGFLADTQTFEKDSCCDVINLQVWK